MTTILVTDKHIAADGLMVTVGGRIGGRDRKKIVRVKGALCAFAGPSGFQAAIHAWYGAGADPAKVPKLDDKDVGSWEMLVVTLEGIFRYSTEIPYPLRMEPPTAIGSGGDYALGAYLARNDVHEAMRVAVHLDAYSGGSIEVIEIEPTLAVLPLAQAAE